MLESASGSGEIKGGFGAGQRDRSIDNRNLRAIGEILRQSCFSDILMREV